MSTVAANHDNSSNVNFEGNDFALQIIAKGAFVDNGSGGGKSFLIETTVIRLNWVALNEWLLSTTFNSRSCYETAEEWEAHKMQYEEKHAAVKKKIVDAVEGIIDENKESVNVSQSQSEVFTLVHIKNITHEREDASN